MFKPHIYSVYNVPSNENQMNAIVTDWKNNSEDNQFLEVNWHFKIIKTRMFLVCLNLLDLEKWR